MNSPLVNILLADDDRDDCILFRDALGELLYTTNLVLVHDGEQLMKILEEGKDPLPDILFLDLNMHRKNGFECLEEIRSIERLANLPVIIFSTSFDIDIVHRLYEKGASHYIRKPNQFEKIKNVISDAIMLLQKDAAMRSNFENFVLPS